MKILAFILTKTGALRWLANIISTSLASWGVISEDQRITVAGAVLAIITAIITQAIESKKATDAKKVQEDRGLKPDGWIGEISREKLTGVRPKSRRPNQEFNCPPGGRGGLRKG